MKLIDFVKTHQPVSMSAKSCLDLQEHRFGLPKPALTRLHEVS